MSAPVINGGKLLLFQLDGQTYAFPLASVERVVWAVAVTPVPKMPDFVAGLINITGDLVPVCSLRVCLGLVDRPVGIDDAFVIVKTSSLRIAVVVDTAAGMGTREADHQSLPPCARPDENSRAHGVVWIDDNIVLIYDLDLVFQTRDRELLRQVIAQGKQREVLS